MQLLIARALPASLIAVLGAALLVGCGGGASSPAASPGAGATVSQATESGGPAARGDIPDNAVFLTYRGGPPPFSIQYVEGWQVTPSGGGVAISDKDSGETVSLVPLPQDVAGYVTSTDLPTLQTRPGFGLIKQDRVTVGGSADVHLAYHVLAAPDPVTGKQVPSTVDRYYIAGRSELALVTLSTPDGVDNVDAFHQMIESFKWS